MKHFIQAGSVIYSLGVNGELFIPPITGTPTVGEFQQYGVTSIADVFTPSNKIYVGMDRVGEVGSGGTFSTKITPQEFSRQIKRIRNAVK